MCIAGAIEQTEFHFRGVLGKQGKIHSLSVPCRTKRKRISWPQMHAHNASKRNAISKGNAGRQEIHVMVREGTYRPLNSEFRRMKLRTLCPTWDMWSRTKGLKDRAGLNVRLGKRTVLLVAVRR